MVHTKDFSNEIIPVESTYIYICVYRTFTDDCYLHLIGNNRPDQLPTERNQDRFRKYTKNNGGKCLTRR